jgi:hypothetical protein
MRSVVIGFAAGLVVAACGAQTPVATVTSPTSPAPSASPAASPTINPADLRLVIEDYSLGQVRLARLDATRTAVESGLYNGVVQGQVIILKGSVVEAMDRTGAVRKLGTLAATPNCCGSPTVVVKPDLTQWVYTVTGSSWTSIIHLGTSAGDRVVATVPSPDGNAFYAPFAWNPSGVYMVREETGLGGAGPFLEYHFNLAKLDLSTGKVTDVTPACIAYLVLDDGTIVCRTSFTDGRLELRSPSGKTSVLQVTGAADGAFSRVLLSPDGKRLIAASNASKAAVNYQMVEAGLSDASSKAFGPIDYVPDTWLPDGRIVADHQCWPSDMGGGTCSTSLDATYIFSADGTTRTLFYKLKTGMVVNYV